MCKMISLHAGMLYKDSESSTTAPCNYINYAEQKSVIAIFTLSIYSKYILI